VPAWGEEANENDEVIPVKISPAKTTSNRRMRGSRDPLIQGILSEFDRLPDEW
jgi:hypothetical protein